MVYRRGPPARHGVADLQAAASAPNTTTIQLNAAATSAYASVHAPSRCGFSATCRQHDDSNIQRNRQRPSRLNDTSYYHWAFERFLSASLLPMTAAACATSGTAYPVLDGLLSISLVMHRLQSHRPSGRQHRSPLSIAHRSACSWTRFPSTENLHERKFPVLGPSMTWAAVGVLVGVMY